MSINEGTPGQVPVDQQEVPAGQTAAENARDESHTPEGVVFVPGEQPAAPQEGDETPTPFNAQIPADVTADDLDTGVEVGNSDHDVSGGKAEENKREGKGLQAGAYGAKLWALVRNGFVEVVRASGNAIEHPFAAHEVRMRDEDTQPVRVIDVTGAHNAENAAGYIVDLKGNIAPANGRRKPLVAGQPAYHDHEKGTNYTSMENSQKFSTGAQGVGAEDDGGSAVVSPEADDSDPLLGKRHDEVDEDHKAE